MNPNKSIDRKLLLEAFVGTTLLCTIAFVLQSSFGFGTADEGLLWYASQRVAQGDVPIRDFFAYDPGRYYWNSLFFHILSDNGLNTLLIAAATFGALGLATSWYVMGVAKVNLKWRILFSIAITVALGYPRHKVYEQSLSLILVVMTYSVLSSPSSLRKWFSAGLVTGIAAIFGRNHGVFFLVAFSLCGIYLLAFRKLSNITQSIASCSLGVVTGYTPIIAMYLLDADFRVAFWQSVLSASNWQLPLPIPFIWTLDAPPFFDFAYLMQISIGLICIAIPIIYLLGAALLFQKSAKCPEIAPALLLYAAASVSGIPYLHQAFDRADFGHIAQATLPVFIALPALASLKFREHWQRISTHTAIYFVLTALIVAWLPNEPKVRLEYAEALHPGSTTKTLISETPFTIDTNQSNFLNKIKKVAEKCNIQDDEFLALPYFPGFYAYLGLKAPFWEMYYLYPRPAELQSRHIEAISNVRLILMSPEAAMDGLERLKLKYIYGDLLKYIEKNYEKVVLKELPADTFLYVDPRSCDLGS